MMIMIYGSEFYSFTADFRLMGVYYVSILESVRSYSCPWHYDVIIIRLDDVLHLVKGYNSCTFRRILFYVMVMMLRE
jgi:hypothetical protein